MRILLWVLSAVFVIPGVVATVAAVQIPSSGDLQEVALATVLAMAGWLPALLLAALAWVVTLLERIRARR